MNINYFNQRFMTITLIHWDECGFSIYLIEIENLKCSSKEMFPYFIKLINCTFQMLALSLLVIKSVRCSHFQFHKLISKN